MVYFVEDAHGNRAYVGYFGSEEAARAALATNRNCKAWDRRKAVWFFGGMGGAETTRPASVSLIGRRGKPLATIYLQPYRRVPA